MSKANLEKIQKSIETKIGMFYSGDDSVFW